MIFDFRQAFGELAACQVVLKVQPLPGHSGPGAARYALRGQLYEALEHCLVQELSRLLNPAASVDPFKGLELDFLRPALEQSVHPLLERQSLALKELVLRPLRLAKPGRSESPGSLHLSHQWLEASVGPIKLKDQFMLVTDVVARVLCNPLAMERVKIAKIRGLARTGRASFAVANPLERLTHDLWGALSRLGPHMGLEDWTLSAGVRASALLAGLQHSPFAKWLEGAHAPYDQKACIDACWITESRVEPARETF